MVTQNLEPIVAFEPVTSIRALGKKKRSQVNRRTSVNRLKKEERPSFGKVNTSWPHYQRQSRREGAARGECQN